jgi:hypothetical protein
MPVLSLSTANARRRSSRVKLGLELLETRSLLSHAGTSTTAAHAAETAASPVAITSSEQAELQAATAAAMPVSANGAPGFNPSYRGVKRPMFHAVTARAQFFPPQGFVFTGVVAGSINTSQDGVFVFGVNRGGATAPGPFPGRPNITFDAEVIVATNSNGVAAQVKILNNQGHVTRTVALPLSAIVFSKTHVGVFVPANLLPSTSPPGTTDPNQNYSFAFWTGTSNFANSQIASFAPQSSNAPFEVKSSLPAVLPRVSVPG